jgi:flagellar hook capping protein FlgD
MSRSLHGFTLLAVLALSTMFAGASFAASASIEQVRNGVASAPTTPIPAWVTGNAGASNAHYLESHSIAYRTVMDGMPTDGSVIELVIAYNVKRSGSYAIDYLTQYQRLLPHVLFGHRDPEVFDPLSGVTGVGAGISTAAIPVPTVNVAIDPDGSDPEPAASQPSTSMTSLPASERVMTLFGGTLIDVSYVSQGDVNLATSSSETQVKVRFIPSGPKAVLAWGGHIACRWDWGFNANGTPRSAGGISGSSYHMRLVNWNLGSLGNQDRSMSTDAVYPVPRCGISNAGPFCAGSTNTHTAPAGMESYAWSLTDNTSGAEIIGSGTGTSVAVRSATAGGYRLVVTTGASGFTKDCETTVTVNAAPGADAGSDQVACATAPQVQLAGVVSGGAGAWSGGAGTFSPGRSALNATYTPSAAEIAAGGVTLTLTCSPLSGPCPPASDPMRITIQPAATANAGADQIVCASAAQVQLAASFGGAAAGGTWSGGAGTFSPGASAPNASYTPSAGEIAAGGVTLTFTTNDPDGPCAAASDQMRVTVNPAATVNAGADQTVCQASPQAQLSASAGGGAASGTWSGGAGSFSPNASAMNATYTPSAAEITAGGVTLTFTSNDPAGPCGAASDQVRITIDRSATANAGADQVVCASSPQVQLAGLVGGGAASGTWSGGAGSFSPGASALNATYTPSAAEIAAGSVSLTLTTNDPAGPCPPASDAMIVTIQPAAVVNAGADLRVCASGASVQLQGSVSGAASSATWSGGGGTFSPKATNLNATYTPTAAEIAAGSVTLTLTTDDPTGPCPAVSDQVRITIDPVTVVNAGPDQTVCSSSPQVQLAGWVTGTVTTGAWTGGGGTFSPGRTSLTAVYSPSAGEIAAGTVTLTLNSAASSGPCPPATDVMTIVITPAVTVNAGPDQIACAVSPQVQLAGSLASGATSGMWSGGTGAFSPGPAALNATYMPSAAEIAAGTVTLTLTTNDPSGPCPAVSDAMTITIDAPTVSVGTRTVCSGVVPVSLCASPGKGIAPFTYRWSNGATSQCIAVSDTGTYTVTMTDARGCQATASGSFRYRDCVGAIAHTNTTCASYMDGSFQEMPSSDVHWATRDNLISTISPGVFFYWTKVTAPSANFTIDVVQTKDNPSFPFIPVLQGQVSRFDATCASMGDGVETSAGQSSITVQGATPGQVLIVSVKYSLKALIGTYMDDTTGCHYDFKTMIGGVVVDGDPDGLQIGAERTPPPPDPGDPNGDAEIINGGGRIPVPTMSGRSEESEPALATYRPSPNPFTHDMRMAYSVAASGERVKISVYDLAGRLVRTLANEVQSAGHHTVAWDGRDAQGTRMRQGVYFVHAMIGNQARQVRVTFVK